MRSDFDNVYIPRDPKKKRLRQSLFSILFIDMNGTVRLGFFVFFDIIVHVDTVKYIILTRRQVPGREKSGESLF